jgi:hypothetical protein
MLGRVRAVQEAEDLTALQGRPGFTNRVREYAKSVMIQAQRMRLA